MVRASVAPNIDSILLQDQGGTPSTPSSGYLAVFCNADDLWWEDDGGNDFHVVTGTTTATCYRNISLPIATGGGTSNVEAFNGAPSINFDADGETVCASFIVPEDWNQASDLTIWAYVANEIAETDNDDVSFTGQVRGYADGDTTGDAGQAVTMALNLTGGDEAINVVNRVTGTIDYDHGTYPIATQDAVIIELAVNLGGGGECTGPLHIVAWGIRYTADRLGVATA